MKINTDIVFITLVYRNYNDLYEFSESLGENVKDKYEILVVDAFYDNATSAKIKEISDKLGLHYIQIENGGYGFGNNRGLDYVETNFEYEYVCICNPDIILKSKFLLKKLSTEVACIAPNIIARKGKRQNPYWVFENKISEKLIYNGYLKENRFLLYSGIGINKIFRIIFGIYSKLKKRKCLSIYACHGCFFILNKEFLEKTKFRYDENMFLFWEEAYLAYEIKRNGDKIIYDPDIEIRHKEDGSMDLSAIKEYPYLKKSFIYYYETYRKR